jgi:tetratricopeptide (TPR) repeat protein
MGKIYIGRPEEIEAHISEALRLRPRDTMAYSWMTTAGIAKNHLGLYDQAVPWYRRAIEANRNFPQPHFALGAALAWLGQLDEARSAVRAGLALNPSFTISRARATWMSDNPTCVAQMERHLEGMRMAGTRIMTASRRLAAILAVDVAGHSRLMGEDEAGTAKIVRERREAATPNAHVEASKFFRSSRGIKSDQAELECDPRHSTFRRNVPRGPSENWTNAGGMAQRPTREGTPWVQGWPALR